MYIELVTITIATNKATVRTLSIFCHIPFHVILSQYYGFMLSIRHYTPSRSLSVAIRLFCVSFRPFFSHPSHVISIKLSLADPNVTIESMKQFCFGRDVNVFTYLMDSE